MHYSILALLNLEGFILLKAEQSFKEVCLTIKSRRKTADCPICKKRSGFVHQHGKWQKIKHLSLGRKQIYLLLQKRRFYCKNCQKVFTESFWLIKPRARKTTFLKQQVIHDLSDLSFKAVWRREKINYHSQTKILKEAVNPFLADWEEEKSQEEIILGIDEVSFAGFDFLPTIANIKSKRLKVILSNDKQKTIQNTFKDIPPEIKPKIKEICLDMRKSYLSAIKNNLPDTKMVVDHFHLIQDANRRINEERRILQQVFKTKIPMRIFLKNKESLVPKDKLKTNDYFKKYPDLKFYYEAKETLRDMYKLKNKEEAQQKLSTLIQALKFADDLGLRQWGRNLSYWGEYILNFFTRRTTNAYMEGLNTKFKLIKRISFGFRNKEIFIRKAFLACLPLTFLPHLLT